MKTKDTRNLAERAEDLEKVITFSILFTIKKHYGGVDEFKRMYGLIVSGKASSEEQVKFCSRFGHKHDEIRRITGRIYGEDGSSRYARMSDITPLLGGRLILRSNFTKHYWSTGKSFGVHSYWYIPFELMEKLMADGKALDAYSGYYTKRQIWYINEVILKGDKMKLTKRQQKEKEVWEAERAQGKHVMSYEEKLKLDLRNKRIAEKGKLTRQKKAVRETIAEFETLQEENKVLKARIKYLEGLKDLNSDMPQSVSGMIKPVEFDELDERMPEGVSQQDMQFLSEDCKRRLSEEAEREFARMGVVADIPGELKKLEALAASGDISTAGVKTDEKSIALKAFYGHIKKLYESDRIPAAAANVFVKRFGVGDEFRPNSWAPESEGHLGKVIERVNVFCDEAQKRIEALQNR